jgi:monoamine oxidase
MNVRTSFLRQLVTNLRQTGEVPPDTGKTARTLHRREFLRGLSLAGAGALTGCFSPRTGIPAKDAPQGAVAIVGGGVAGLTAAYRLQRRGVEVHLYEASRRLGGRMWTKRNFNADDMFCELGGELVDSNHRCLIALARELGVELQALKTGQEHGGEFYFIGNRTYTDADLIRAYAPLARRIAGDAKGLYTADGAFTEKAHTFDQVKLSDYLREAGRATGTAEWLIRTLDVAYTTEYGLDTSVQSALNFIDLISPDTSEGFKVYGDSDEAWRVAGGNGSLPDALARRLAGRIQLYDGHRLSGIADDGTHVTLTFAAERASKSVRYTRVILAAPFTMLREVSGIRRLALSPAKHRAIQELGYGQSAKVMFGFHDRFWRQLTPRSNGGVFSDALFEAWETSQKQPGRRGILTCFIGGSAARRFSSGAAAGYLDQLDHIFPGAKAAYDGNTANMDWTRFAFSKGSFSAPLVGQYCGMITAAGTPELGGRLLFAGEHTSEESPGFMNGGVESGERVALQVMAGAVL